MSINALTVTNRTKRASKQAGATAASASASAAKQ